MYVTMTTSESFENWSDYNTRGYAIMLKFRSSNCTVTYWESFSSLCIFQSDLEQCTWKDTNIVVQYSPVQ